VGSPDQPGKAILQGGTRGRKLDLNNKISALEFVWIPDLPDKFRDAFFL
jgi:hypothetical protein